MLILIFIMNWKYNIFLAISVFMSMVMMSMAYAVFLQSLLGRVIIMTPASGYTEWNEQKRNVPKQNIASSCYFQNMFEWTSWWMDVKLKTWMPPHRIRIDSTIYRKFFFERFVLQTFQYSLCLNSKTTIQNHRSFNCLVIDWTHLVLMLHKYCLNISFLFGANTENENIQWKSSKWYNG